MDTIVAYATNQRKQVFLEELMGIADDAVEIRARGWRTLASLHGLIDAALEKDLTAQAGLSVVEYTLLDALNRQDGWHMRMAQLARATALSPSATTRLVTRHLPRLIDYLGEGVGKWTAPSTLGRAC